jgi:hypothetical protein
MSRRKLPIGGLGRRKGVRERKKGEERRGEERRGEERRGEERRGSLD